MLKDEVHGTGIARKQLKQLCSQLLWARELRHLGVSQHCGLPRISYRTSEIRLIRKCCDCE